MNDSMNNILDAIDAWRQHAAGMDELVRTHAEWWIVDGRKADYESYYDLIATMPIQAAREARPDLARRVDEAEAKGAAFHHERESILGEIRQAHRIALAAIGRHAGGIAAAEIERDPGIPLQQVRDRATSLAADLRRELLDGKESGFDPTGPLTIALRAEIAKTLGVDHRRGGWLARLESILQDPDRNEAEPAVTPFRSP